MSVSWLCPAFHFQTQPHAALVHSPVCYLDLQLQACPFISILYTLAIMFNLKCRSALSGGNGSWIGPCLGLQPHSYSILPFTLGPLLTVWNCRVLIAFDKYLSACYVLHSLLDVGPPRALFMIQIGEGLGLEKESSSENGEKWSIHQICGGRINGTWGRRKHFGCLLGSGLCSWNDSSKLKAPYRLKTRVLLLSNYTW